MSTVRTSVGQQGCGGAVPERLFIVDDKVRRRFDAKVDKSGDCWLWTAATNEHGYGMFGMRETNGRYSMQKAHRVAWFMAHGGIPSGLCVLHSCDNPACVNPAHLSVGTQEDNLHDMARKGRAVSGCQSNGENHPLSKLTDDAVKDIRHRYAAGGMSQQALADRYGVSQHSVSAVIRHKTWKHVA